MREAWGTRRAGGALGEGLAAPVVAPGPVLTEHDVSGPAPAVYSGAPGHGTAQVCGGGPGHLGVVTTA